jgi:glycogen operon protein
VPLVNPPVLWEIESDPVLAGTKLIAEAWDPAGLYQVGSFVGDSWKEWNGKFRDDVRSFLKGDGGTARKLAYRMLGSPDIYAHKEREPEQSVNFVTCHDGFTLNDLVSYDRKHNESNLEDNRDGTDYNLSWNCGTEGPTSDPAIERLRNRQIKNFFTITLLSIGTPMLLMGDEVRRTQRGNNNAYCQDDEISWFDWTLPDKHPDVYRFVKELIHFRLHRGAPKRDYDMTLTEVLHKANIQWHGIKLNRPDWGDSSHTLAFTVRRMSGELIFHVMLNAYWEPLSFDLPPLAPAFDPGWRRWLDTFLESPEDICAESEAPAVAGESYLVQPRSVAVLYAGLNRQKELRVAPRNAVKYGH